MRAAASRAVRARWPRAVLADGGGGSAARAGRPAGRLGERLDQSIGGGPGSAGSLFRRWPGIAALQAGLSRSTWREEQASLPLYCRLGVHPGAVRFLASGRQQSFYEVLGVPPSATQADIKRAYLQEAKKCHPDVNSSADATARFQALAQAYQVLGNATSRASYDSAGANADPSTYQTPPPPNQGPVDPTRLFRAVLEELGVEDLKNYFAGVGRDAALASSAAQAGDFQPAKDFAWKHKGLFASIALPTVLLLRFPALIMASFRIVASIAALFGSALLRDPRLQQMVGRYFYHYWHIFTIRVQARARDKKP
mmetsp:Transcript_7768/g.28423  ORF Transcript_7768/g.28423 Transcript_7768/m.28423 type:complete len:311 (-) Transcript_7768:73-1005(-)